MATGGGPSSGSALAGAASPAARVSAQPLLPSPIGASGAAPPAALLRCTSTPVVPTFFDLRALQDGEAHMSFCGWANTSVRPSTSSSALAESPASPSLPPVTLRRSPRGHKSVGGGDQHHPRKPRVSIESDDDSGVHSLSLAATTSEEEHEDISRAQSPVSDTSKGAVPKKRHSPRLKALLANRRSAELATDVKSSLRQRDICSAPSLEPVSAESASPARRILYPPGHFLHRDHVDIVRHLSEMNAAHIVVEVFQCLSGKDLSSVACVSLTWAHSLSLASESAKRKKQYVEECKRNRENLNESTSSSSHYFLRSPRKAMAEKSNVLVSPGTRAKRERDAAHRKIASPSKIRHQLFTQEALKLAPGEQLQPCPRCTQPSRVRPQEHAAECSRAGCGFNFCTLCMCEAHKDGDKGCKKASKSSSRSAGCVAGKKSRSRLKRIL